MAQDTNILDRERELLVRSIEEAHETLRLMPGVDENGPLLVWLADHLLQAYNHAEQPA